MSNLFIAKTRQILLSAIAKRTTATATVPSLKEQIKVTPPNQIAKHSTPGSIYEPPYLRTRVPFPAYPILNINLYSYDYTPINVYYKYVRTVCVLMNVNVLDAYPMPSREQTIKTYRPYSSGIASEIKMRRYHRCVRINSLKTTLAPLLYEVIQMNLPEGVTLHVCEANNEQDDFRYVPDVEINVLKDEIAKIEEEK